jgi:hypothetical protein
VTVKVPEARLGEFYADFGRWLHGAASAALEEPPPGPVPDDSPVDGGSRPWELGSIEERMVDAAELYDGISIGAREALDYLIGRAGTWVPDTAFAEALGLAGPLAVAGTLASVSTRARHLRRDLPYQYLRSQNAIDSKGEYRIPQATATLLEQTRTAIQARKRAQAATAWIFQGNPKMFDIDRYLREQYERGEEVVWTCRPKRHVEPGQRVFVWRADGRARGSGGIVALGEALAEPEFIRDASALWKPGAPYANTPEWRVRIRLLEEPRLTPGQGMILRTELEGDPIVGSLQILHYRALTVCAVAAQQERELLRLWSERKRPVEDEG